MQCLADFNSTRDLLLACQLLKVHLPWREQSGKRYKFFHIIKYVLIFKLFLLNPLVKPLDKWGRRPLSAQDWQLLQPPVMTESKTANSANRICLCRFFWGALLTCFSFMSRSCRYQKFQFNLACKLGSKPQYQDLTRDIEMAEPEDDVQEFLRPLHLPEEVRDALLHNGYDCTLTFGLAFSSMQMLDQHIHKFLVLGETDLTSPTCARIPRAFWTKCNNLHTATPIPPAQPSPPTPPSTEPSSQITATSNWHDSTTQAQHWRYGDNEGSIRQKLPRWSTWCSLHSFGPPLVFGTSTKDQQAHQVHPNPTSTEWTSVMCYDRNKIIKTPSKWNSTSLTALLGWHTGNRHQFSSLFSRLAQSNIHSSQECPGLMWNVPVTSIQSIWLQDQWAHVSSARQRVGTTTRYSPRDLLRW